MRFHFILLLLLTGCGHQKVTERQKEKIKQQMSEIEQQYEKELEIADVYKDATRKERKYLMNLLYELIMVRGESYHANYELMMLNPYRSYPFLKVNGDLDGKIKFLNRRLKTFAEEFRLISSIQKLINRLGSLKELIMIQPQYTKECRRYQKYRLVESAADFACHEIEDLKDNALSHERIYYS